MVVAPTGKRSWRWVGVTAAVVLAAALIGMGVSAFLFSRWSTLETVSPLEAERAFEAAAHSAGGGPPYVVIGPGGDVAVRRELEGPGPSALRKLHLLAWEPDTGRLVRIGFPYWFVRAKMTDTVNLGTITTALSGDWKNLDLRVSERDLEMRGPGLVLDHRLADGTRLLLWTQ